MKNLLITILSLIALNLSAQSDIQPKKGDQLSHKYRISVPGIIIPQLFEKSWNERTHTQHIEIHLKQNLDNKNIIGVKLASWRLFQPMGITWWDGLLDKIDSESEFYPGHLRESGIGITYQRMLWKGLFTTVEVLPLFKTYLDEDGKKVGDGFKLYNSYHVGYHIDFGKDKRYFIEPQVHCQHWMLDSGTPEGFKQLNDKWRNYFLFEPNIYLGVNF